MNDFLFMYEKPHSHLFFFVFYDVFDYAMLYFYIWCTHNKATVTRAILIPFHDI